MTQQQPPQPQYSSAITKALKVDYDDPSQLWITSQKTLRRLIGYLGIGLPIMIWLVVWIDSGHLQPMSSISHYYFTRANSIFITVVSLMAIFLLIYKGQKPIDFYVSSLAGIGALLLVLFPTSNIADPCSADLRYSTAWLQLTDYTPFRVTFHLVSAAVFLTSLAFMSIFIFTRDYAGSPPMKKVRNFIYRACGIIMITALLMIVLGFTEVINPEFYESHQLTFWFETLAVSVFGISWLVKGQTLFKN